MTTVHHVKAFDPGYVTGFAHYVFSDDVPAQRVDYRAMTVQDVEDFVYDTLAHEHEVLERLNEKTHYVMERFVPEPGGNFDAVALRVEGKLEMINAYGRLRSDKQQVPDDLLKNHGLWLTGNQVSWEDGRDVNDAQIHALGYVAFDLNHIPTLRAYFK